MKYIYTENFKNLIYFISLLFLITITCLILNVLFKINVFGHDDLMNVNSYYYNLLYEGRWLNYLLFPVVSKLNPHLCQIISLLCIFYFGYKCAAGYLECRISVLCAFAFMQIPSIYFFTGTWPLVGLTSYLFLALSAFVYNKINRVIFYVFFSIIFFGIYQNFYNLLLLLCLGDILNGKLNFFRIVIIFSAALITGYLCSQIIVYLYSGDFIHTADWRSINNVHNINDIINNIKKAYLFIVNHLTYLNKTFLIVISILIVLSLVSSFKYNFHCINININIMYFILVVIFTACSFHVVSLPIGFDIYYRSEFSLYASLILLIIIVSRFNIIYYAIVISIIANIYFLNNYKLLYSRYIITSTYLEQLYKIDADPYLRILVFLSNSNELAKTTNTISKINDLAIPPEEDLTIPLRWTPVARTAGYSKVYINNEAQEIYNRFKNLNFETDGLYDYAKRDEFLFIKISDFYSNYK